MTCRGVPLRIFNDPTLLEEKPVRKVAPELNKNEAAVDASHVSRGAPHVDPQIARHADFRPRFYPYYRRPFLKHVAQSQVRTRRRFRPV